MEYYYVLKLDSQASDPIQMEGSCGPDDVKGAGSEDGDYAQAQRIGTGTKTTHSRGFKSERVRGTTSRGDEREKHKKSSRTAFSKRAKRQSVGSATRLAERRDVGG